MFYKICYLIYVSIYRGARDLKIRWMPLRFLKTKFKRFTFN